jgi:hypothetical protein
MSPDVAASFALVILMAPMAYFLLASPSFLFVKLDIPPVAKLLRGMFHGYFIALAIAGVVGTVGLAVAGRPAFLIGIAVVAFAVFARRWFLRRIDAQLGPEPAGDGGMARGLRRLHVAGMLCNAAQFVLVVGCIPYIMVAPA